jgi:chromosome segregation ATPase
VLKRSGIFCPFTNWFQSAEDKERFVRGQLKARLKEIEELRDRVVDNGEARVEKSTDNSQVDKLNGELRKDILSLNEDKKALLHSNKETQEENERLKLKLSELDSNSKLSKKDKKDKEKKENYKKEISKLKKEIEELKKGANGSSSKNQDSINVLIAENELLKKQATTLQESIQKEGKHTNEKESVIRELQEKLRLLDEKNAKSHTTEASMHQQLVVEKENLLARVSGYEIGNVFLQHTITIFRDKYS